MDYEKNIAQILYISDYQDGANTKAPGVIQGETAGSFSWFQREHFNAQASIGLNLLKPLAILMFEYLE